MGDSGPALLMSRESLERRHGEMMKPLLVVTEAKLMRLASQIDVGVEALRAAFEASFDGLELPKLLVDAGAPAGAAFGDKPAAR